MSRVNFFSNTTINLKSIDLPTRYYPAPRDNAQAKFTVPEHNINTTNLLVFVNGILKYRETDYDDINSFEVQFKYNIKTTDSVFTILLNDNIGKNNKPTEITGDGTYWEDEENQRLHIFKKRKEEIPSDPVYDGQIFYATDTEEQFLALPNNTLLKISDVKVTDKLPEKGLENKIYVTDDGIFTYSFKDKMWKKKAGNGQDAESIKTKMEGICPFKLGEVIGWNKIGRRYDALDEKLDPVGIVTSIYDNFFYITNYGHTHIKVGFEEGSIVYANEGKISKQGVPIGKVINGELFFSIAGESNNKNKNFSSGLHDIVFVLGDTLNRGGQNHCELWLPYEGVIKEIYFAIGKDSSNSTNIVVSLQQYLNSWNTLYAMNLDVTKKEDKFKVNIPFRNIKIRPNIVSGELNKVTNMSIILRAEIQ